MNNEVDKKLIRKCTLCGREYLKPQAICPKCNIVLMKLSDYERLGMEANRANFQKEVERQEKLQKQQKQQNIPKCPICQSTNLSKITNTRKAGKIALFGIFGAGDLGKTWKCNNCGSKF